MADAHSDGRTGSTTPGKVTRPETTGAKNTHSDTASTSAPGNSASASASASASTSTLPSNSSTTTSSPQRIINHNPSTNSLRNINTGGTRIETGTGRGTGAVQNAALTGAALAFSNAKGKATPVVLNKFAGKTQLGDNGLGGKDGALAAATKARVGGGGSPNDGGGRARSPSKVSVTDTGTGGEQQIYGYQKVGRERTGESETDGGSVSGGPEYQGGPRIPQKRNQRPNGHLLPPFSATSETSSNVKNNSAAFMAANLAAKRSRESSPSHTGQNYAMGMGMGKQASPLPSRRQSYASSIDSTDRRVDLSSIPPTSNLVEMWEQPDKGVKKERGVVSNRGNEIVNRRDQKRPVSSHTPIPVLKPAGLTRPVSSHVSESSVQSRTALSQAPISEQVKSKSKPAVHPRPSSSQASVPGPSKSVSKPVVQPPPVSSHTTSSEAPKPSPKSPVQKPVIFNTRPASSHGPMPNLSTKPPIQKLSRPVSSHGPSPVKPSAKPSLQSIRPTSSHTPESTELSSKTSIQKPSLPPPRRKPANISASEDQSTNLPMHAPQPRSMQSPILTTADRTEPTSESPTQPPRRSSTTKTPRRSSKSTSPSRPPVSRQSYNNDADDDESSDDSFVSASSQPKPKSPSLRAKIAEQKRLQTSTYAPSMTAETLSNAMVAGYLASSRASTPSISSGVIQPPAPPPPRRLKKLFHSDHSRTPTPPQNTLSATGVPTMKTTMRKPKTEKELKEEEGEGERRRAKKHLVKKHPNKHDEGNRKRWRDEITEKERKRYEALWASNKGLFPYTMDPRGEIMEIEGAADTVPGMVVKDLWERSRLGGDVLEEVWELVHGKGYWGRHKQKRFGRLERDEFVVGLWLIDQRLKGRKLPARVNHSIWASAS